MEKDRKVGLDCLEELPGHMKDQNEVSIVRMASLGLKAGGSKREHIQRAKSTSAHFLVNINELIYDDVPGRFGEKGTILGRAPSAEIGLFSLPASSLPCDDIFLHEDDKIRGTSPADEEDRKSNDWRKMQIKPTEPLYLDFQDVKYKVTVKGEKLPDAEKCIIHGVSGSVRPGEVLALMGPSGGGKTTLLNLLSGRIKINSGIITYNDQPYSKSLKRRIGYVLQDDVVFPHLTVKETLTYAALLRLPKTLTRHQKKERAINVISEIGLERCQDTIIGGGFIGGISGGERKRLCIGNEILLNPSLLFLDEPTSGLDSTAALRIVQMLRNISEGGKTVVTTIHQPSSRLFSKFDKLMLLGEGSCLYFGKASEAMVYFSSIGCSPLINMDPAEFLIDLSNGNMKDKSVPTELEVKILPPSQKLEGRCGALSPLDVHEYLVGAYEARVTNMDQTNISKPIVGDIELEIQSKRSSRDWETTWWEQFSILFTRGLQERRHEHLSSVRVFQVLSTAIIVGLLWWRSDASTPKGLHDQAGLLFFISVFWAFFPIFTAIFTFPQERAMLLKERSVDMYRLSAYLMARNSSDLPLDLILPTVFMLIVYFMVGLKPRFSSLLLTLLTIFLSIVAAQGLGLSIGAAFMDVKKATTLASVTVMTFMLSGGFFIHKLPQFMAWIKFISVNYHSYRLLLKIQYGCSGPGSELGSCESPFVKGQRLDGGTEVAAMLGMVIGYRLLTYLFLRRMKLRKIS